MTDSKTCIIAGVGPFISSSLARILVIQGWSIALISRSQGKLEALTKELQELKQSNAKVVTHEVDVGDSNGFLQALDTSKNELGSVDVLCYNAARVGPDDLMTVKTEVLEADFKTCAIGTLVAGQWFAKNADTSKVSKGEYPLLLVTGGVLHKQPYPSYASLSTVKSASQNLATNFAQVLPKEFNVQVGQPLVVQPIIPKEGGGYQTKSDPDAIVDTVFMPYFEDRMKIGKDTEWKAERVF